MRIFILTLAQEKDVFYSLFLIKEKNVEELLHLTNNSYL